MNPNAVQASFNEWLDVHVRKKEAGQIFLLD